MSHDAIENLSHEDRTFPPTAEFAAHANAGAELYAQANADRIGFWEEQAAALQWETPWTTALDWSDAPFARWFDGGTLRRGQLRRPPRRCWARRPGCVPLRGRAGRHP